MHVRIIPGSYRVRYSSASTMTRRERISITHTSHTRPSSSPVTCSSWPPKVRASGYRQKALGLCPHGNWNCSPLNTARTCFRNGGSGDRWNTSCAELPSFPNATVLAYGSLQLATGMEAAMQREIYQHGPIQCHVISSLLHSYDGGAVTATNGTSPAI